MENENQPQLENKGTNNQDNESELIELEWEAPEFENPEKGHWWFIIVGIVALAVFTIALLMSNFIFALLIVISVFIIFVFALKKPKIVKFKIDGSGIMIDEKLLSYRDLRSFWIFYDPPHIKELSIKSKKWLMTLIKIPLEQEDPSQIREALIKFIPEEEQEQSLIDVITRRIGF
ncbi:MAG: hypothetical protein HY764_04625 [Candidatus Portnoybacteria bacterium]|nr:hypothetical protein [Candidatus Portnoybacteria bacterium]